MLAIVCRTILVTGHLICGHQMPEGEAITTAFKFAEAARAATRRSRNLHSQLSTPFVIREHDAAWPDALAAAAATAARKADAAKLKVVDVHSGDSKLTSKAQTHSKKQLSTPSRP